jgi:glutaredoxin 3
MAEVVIYTSALCGYCHRAKDLLERKGVPYTEVPVDLDPVRRTEMEQRSGRRTVPQVFIGARHVGGYDDLAALERAGQLDALLRDPAS